MMRTLTHALRTILLIILFISSTSTALAHDFEVNGIYYNIVNNIEAAVTYRGSNYFAFNNEYTSSVTIPTSVTIEGITYSVTSIGNYAFCNCTGLTNITIPNSVTSIGDNAFSECSGLTSITIPNSVTSIGDNAFFECSGLTIITVESENPYYDSRNNCNAIIKTATNTLLTGCMNTIIPSSVKTIGARAFEGCIGLTSVDIPNSVTSIGDYAFYKCSGLTSINIPSSVKTIGAGAFEGCIGLTSVDIPNSVKTIGDYAFCECSGLTSITVESGNPYYDSRNNCNAIIKTATNTLLTGCMNTTIPNSVTTIGNAAFLDCTGLTSVTIPYSVTSIGYSAFRRCSGLTSITVENGNPNYDFRNNCNAIIESATNTLITGCMNTTIPNSVKTIGDCAFEGCIGLTSITIPSSVTSIGFYAFQGCSNLASIDIPNSISSIGAWAFNKCTGLNSVNITDITAWCGIYYKADYSSNVGTFAYNANPLVYAHHLYLNGEEIKDLVIPNSVTKINRFAFQECFGLNSIWIPKSVTSIDNYAFDGCNGLTSITVESGNSRYDSRDNCNAIINSATNTLITGCMNTIIPSSVTSIGEDAFYHCIGLDSIIIPRFVTSIGKYAFYGCSGLTSFTCLAITPPKAYDYTFSGNVTNQATLYVPEESVSAYQTATYWKNFSLIVGITVTSDFEVDGVWYHAINENTAMVISKPGDEEYYSGDVVIPETVSYEDYTFAVTAIDEGAFEDCYELTSVVIGDAVETIGENAFQGCSDLTSVTIGTGVTSIGAKAFNYCNALQTVTCMGTVPPAMASSNCFSNAAYSRAVLKVPRPEIETYAAANYWYKFNNIQGWGYLGPGDVNGNGSIDMDDLTIMINIMLTDDLGDINPTWVDVTGNGIVSMNDLTELINILLTQ